MIDDIDNGSGGNMQLPSSLNTNSEGHNGSTQKQIPCSGRDLDNDGQGDSGQVII